MWIIIVIGHVSRRVRVRWWCYVAPGDTTPIQTASFSPTTYLTPETRTTWPAWATQLSPSSGSASRWATWKLTTPNMPSSPPLLSSQVFLSISFRPSNASLSELILPMSRDSSSSSSSSSYYYYYYLVVTFFSGLFCLFVVYLSLTIFFFWIRNIFVLLSWFIPNDNKRAFNSYVDNLSSTQMTRWYFHSFIFRISTIQIGLGVFFFI